MIIAVDRFFKMSYFIFYRKTIDAHPMTKLFFKKVVCLLGIPLFIALDKDIKFFTIF